MRLFISINVPQNLHTYCKQLQNQFSGIKNTDNFHITLQFLGNDIKSTKLIIDELNKIKFKSFEVEMGDAELFGYPNNPKGVWIKCKNNYVLNKLSDDIQKAMRSLGYLSDLPFIPHITLGHYKNPPGNKPKLLKGKSHKFSVNTFYLIQSLPTSIGSKYKIIETFLTKN